MSTSTENIMLHLTGKSSAGDVTVEDLEAIAGKYPSFGVAKFLLAKKAQDENHGDFNTYARQAILHFNNPYWFHFKLNEETLMRDETNLVKPLAPLSPTDDGITGKINENIQEEAAVAAELNNWQPVEEEIIMAEGPVEQDEIVPLVPKEELPVEDDEIIPAVTREEISVEDDEIIPAVAREEINIEEDEVVPTPPRDEVPVEEDEIIPAVTREEVHIEEDEIIPATVLDEAVIEDEHPTENSEAHIPQTADEHIITSGDENISAEETGDEEDLLPVDGSQVNEKLSAVLQGQLKEFNKPVTADTPIPIETGPYHTVDYFASQGIKLSLELQKQDNLGVKVKKFTDWLKQMKRISPAPSDLGIDEAAEHKVQDIAATSNETKEVLTEAMAEVLAKQGMNEKAIQVYKKLSFLHPDKSAYFAAKIQHLKGL